MLGADHPDTLIARGHLAYWRGEAGDTAGAATGFEALLQRIWCGCWVPMTATPSRPADIWPTGEGRPGTRPARLPGSRRCSRDLVRVLGADHRDTLITRGHLAYWRGEAGDAAGAAAGFEALLADLVRVLGADDRVTLVARGHLARWRGEAGYAAGT